MCNLISKYQKYTRLPSAKDYSTSNFSKADPGKTSADDLVVIASDSQ